MRHAKDWIGWLIVIGAIAAFGLVCYYWPHDPSDRTAAAHGHMVDGRPCAFCAAVARGGTHDEIMKAYDEAKKATPKAR